MPMSNGGLTKLLEELGELSQVAAKKIAYFDTDNHPDGGLPLSIRLEQEMADVMAAIYFVIDKHKLNYSEIDQRRLNKLRQYIQWDNE